MSAHLPFINIRCILSTFLYIWFIGSVSAGQNPSKIRNVLFLVSDDLKASVLGCYGNSLCKTPHIDALARDGMVFERAYCQGTWCAPSRTSFMYSRYLEKGQKTLGEHFRAHGVYSCRVGKIFHMRVPGDIIDGTHGNDVAACWDDRFNSPGLEAHTPGDYACLNLNIFTDELEGRQSTRMPHRMFVSVQHDGNGADQPDHKSATKAIELLRSHQEERFFLAVGFVRPHYPMVAPRSWFKAHPWQQIPLPPSVDGDLDDIPKLGIASGASHVNGIDRFPDNQKKMWQAYFASVAFMDEQVGRVLTELERLGLRETTAIVFTSDHGYHLGEHTFWQKSNLHEEVIRVPLIVSVPGLKPGRTESIAELVDLYPTLSELSGLPERSDLHGTSLVPVLKEPQLTIKQGALSFNKGTSWRTRDWAYMRYRDGTEELYDMVHDPHQFTNLVDEADYAEQRKRMARQLAAREQALNLKLP